MPHQAQQELEKLPQRIVHVSFGLDMGGLERLLLGIAENTDPRRQQLFFISLGSIGNIGLQLRRLGWPVVCLHRPHGVRLSLILSLARIFHGIRPAVIHTHDARALIYGAPAARLMGIRKLVHTQHGQNLDMTPRRLTLVRFAAALTQHYVCVSQDAHRIASSQGIRADRLRVIYNGIDVKGQEAAANVQPSAGDREPKVLVAIARLSPEKDISTLLRAVALLQESIPDLRLEVAGEGPCHAELLHEANHLGIYEKVHFLGQVSDPASVLRRGKVFVLPSISEGISLTLLEAMAAGVPAIATNVGGNSEVINDGTTGVLVPPQDPESLAEAIRKLWFHGDMRIQLASAAKRRVAEHFDIRRMAYEYEQLYRGKDLKAADLSEIDITNLQQPVTAGEDKMKVVVVDWDVTYPANSGKRLRTLNLMLQLAARHDITYLSRGDENSIEGNLAREFLNDRGIATVFANLPLPRKSTWTYKARVAAHLWSQDPLAVALHRSAPFADAIQQYAKKHRVDLWQFEWTPYVQMLPKSQGIRSLIVAHNVDSLIWQRYVETECNPIRRRLFESQWRKFRDFERATFNQASGVIAVSDSDANLLRDDFGVRNVDVVENGVDVDSYSEPKAERDSRELLFLGSLDWRANLDAVELLLNDILPRVLLDEPSAQLRIVGRNPPARLVAKIATLTNVVLHADVPDVRPYLSKAGIMVVPLRIGGGSRLKILEALANSLPVISSTVGAEGLQLSANEELIIADGVEKTAKAIIQGIRQPAELAALTSRGFELVTNHYSWERIARQLESVWERTVAPTTLVEQPC